MTVDPPWPLGFYAGTIDAPAWLKPFGLIWRGKAFSVGMVTNQIGPFLLFRGYLLGNTRHFHIRYHRWLIDTVHYAGPGVYTGHLALFGVTVRFTLRGPA